MKIRELILRIPDKFIQGHNFALFFNDLDKEVDEVLNTNQDPDYVQNLRNVLREFGGVEEKERITRLIDNTNAIKFIGNGKDVIELVRKTLCDFKEIYVDEAVLATPDKTIEYGTVEINLVINIPEEKKWVNIYYSHLDKGIGFGSIAYREHNYSEEPLSINTIEKLKNKSFPWGNELLSGNQILEHIFTKDKCKVNIGIPLERIKVLKKEDIQNLELIFKSLIERLQEFHIGS